jgi:hypothetical protein
MTRLFIELYLDEDIDSLVATLIRNLGFAATTAREEGRLRRTDREQLAFATENGKAILTHNRNHYIALANEYYASGRNHYGIIIARRRAPQELVRLLIAVLDRVIADEFQNQVRYI